jgi:hypothetical protein
MRIGGRVFWVLAIMFLLPVPARSQTPLGGSGRGASTWYAGVGIIVSGDVGLGAMVRAGAILNDHFSLGAEAGISGYGAEEYTYADAMATWYPFARSGAYLKGGVGYGSSKEDQPDGSAGESKDGVEGRLGAGWEFKAVHLFTKDLCIGLEVATAANSAARSGDLWVLITLGLY